MRKQAKTMAACSMAAALGVVVMLLGAVLELGIYLCPMIVGLCLIPIGRQFGVKYQLLVWIAVSILSLLLVPNPEENLIFACLFGWYPALQPRLQKLPKLLRSAVKLLLFNAIVIALEALVIHVLMPEVIADDMLLLLLLLGNVMFVMYDRLLDRFDVLEAKFRTRFFRK